MQLFLLTLFLFEFLIPLSNSAISLRAAAFFLVVAPRLPDRQQRQRCGIKCTNFRKPKSVWSSCLSRAQRWWHVGYKMATWGRVSQRRTRGGRKRHRQHSWHTCCGGVWWPSYNNSPSSLFICWESCGIQLCDRPSQTESCTEMHSVWEVLHLQVWTPGASAAAHRRKPLQVLSVWESFSAELWSIKSQADTVQKSSVHLHQMREKLSVYAGKM